MFNKKLNKLVDVAMVVTIHLYLSFLPFLITVLRNCSSPFSELTHYSQHCYKSFYQQSNLFYYFDDAWTPLE